MTSNGEATVTSANTSVGDPTTGGTGGSGSAGSLFGVRDCPNPTGGGNISALNAIVDQLALDLPGADVSVAT